MKTRQKSETAMGASGCRTCWARHDRPASRRPQQLGRICITLDGSAWSLLCRGGKGPREQWRRSRAAPAPPGAVVQPFADSPGAPYILLGPSAAAGGIRNGPSSAQV